jgi:hypothetical protein
MITLPYAGLPDDALATKSVQLNKGIGNTFASVGIGNWQNGAIAAPLPGFNDAKPLPWAFPSHKVPGRVTSVFP